jgi:hypothetical protein
MVLVIVAGCDWQAAMANAAKAIRLLIVPPHPIREDAMAAWEAQSPKRKTPLGRAAPAEILLSP